MDGKETYLVERVAEVNYYDLGDDGAPVLDRSEFVDTYVTCSGALDDMKRYLAERRVFFEECREAGALDNVGDGGDPLGFFVEQFHTDDDGAEVGLRETYRLVALDDYIAERCGMTDDDVRRLANPGQNDKDNHKPSNE